ncbi:hypothetical protein [Mesoflavibacter sp. SCSIO 43206]|uniref:hypothetical protein n=1 Tax=Mesoflavibacter sp. SCSIO 43206 TaxID=2779362 RepID=UPI001CA80E4C|nr:hypothetical protein [Mesoflavibacter sp. SCSIO 43206]UAB75670.1 hypothetical protein INR78_01375 [Mesoflavibacter sp. SCSIO 43206]
MEENKENEPKKDEESVDFKPLIDLIKTSLKDLKINEIVESSNKVKIEKINAEKTFNNRNLTFWKWKFVKDVIVNLLILGTIILLSMNKIIEGSIVGTLLGSVIGYSIGNGFSKNQKD